MVIGVEVRGWDNKCTANVLRRFNVHLFLTRGTYSIKIFILNKWYSLSQKRKREEFTSSFSYIIWNTNMQNPHHWKKINIIKWFLHQGLARLSERARVEPQTWLVFTIYTQSEDKLKTWSVGWRGDSSRTPRPRAPSALHRTGPKGGATGRLRGSLKKSHGGLDEGKLVKDQKWWRATEVEKEREV